MKEQLNIFSILAFIFGCIAIFSVTTVIFPLAFGSLAIIFAILSKGNSLKMDSMTKCAAVISAGSIVLSCLITVGTIYLLATNEEYRANVNTAFEEFYGITMEEYMELLQETYETGELPEELNDIPNQINY